MARIPPAYHSLIDNALADGVPCLLGTSSPEGYPEISPKGSMLVLDEGTLAYWERAHRGALRNIEAQPHVVVYYRNPAKSNQLPRGAAIRFYGVASVVGDDQLREQIMNRIVRKELEADPERTGVAILIRINRVTDLRGQDIQE